MPKKTEKLQPISAPNPCAEIQLHMEGETAAMKGAPWEFEYIANLLLGANPRSVFVEYEPGNATRYSLLIVPVTALCAVGANNYFKRGECIVSWVGNSKSYTFHLGLIDEGYLANKLGIENRADASQIAIFLNRIAEVKLKKE